MSDAFIIETSTVTAGIIAAHGRGFRFYASHPAMFALDGRTFSSVRAAQRAAEVLAKSAETMPPRRRASIREPFHRVAAD